MFRNRSNVVMGAIVLLAGAAGWILGSREDSSAQALRGVETTANREFRSRVRERGAEDRQSPDQVMRHYLKRDPMGSNLAAQLDLWKIVSGYSAEQCRAALAVLSPADPTERFPVHVMLFSRLAEIDPQAAMMDAGSQPESMAPTFRNTVLGVWLRDDPEAACRWALKNLEEKETGMLPNQVANVLMEYGPREAVRRASALGEKFVSATLTRLGKAVAEDGTLRDEFLELLNDQGADVKKAGLKGLLIAESRVDPGKTLASLGEFGLADEKGRTSTRHNILRGWLEREPASAMNWAEGNPVSLSAGERAELFQRWNREHPEEALAWLETQPKPGNLAMGLTKDLYGNVSGSTLGEYRSDKAKAKAAEDFTRSYKLWHAERPEEAEKWRSSMVPSVREMLEGGGL